MSYLTKAEAVAAGRKVLAEVRAEFPKAKLCTFENLGWYWGIQIGNLCLSYYKRRNGRLRYITLFSGRGTGGGGEMYWNKNESFSSPLKAIEAQLKLAEAHVLRCQAAINSVDRCREGK